MVKSSFIKTFLTILVGHTLICDVGAFVLGRFTDIDWRVGIVIVIMAALAITMILEKPWIKDS
jgi:biotin transporter BioY